MGKREISDQGLIIPCPQLLQRTVTKCHENYNVSLNVTYIKITNYFNIIKSKV